MATGTGKTKLSIAMLYRLLSAKRFRRICFVVDRSALADQAEGEFSTTKVVSGKTFADIFGLKGLEDIRSKSVLRAGKHPALVAPSLDAFRSFVLYLQRAHIGWPPRRVAGPRPVNRKKGKAMNVRKTFALIGCGLAISIAQSSSAAPAPNAKLWGGTWQLNTAKSKFSAPDFSEKAETRIYAVSGNRIMMKSTTTAPSGKQRKWSYSAAWDGKSYPTSGNSNADHIVLMPVSDREVKSRTMLKGKASANTTASVSDDGKQITMKRSILTAKGGPSNDVLVFDRKN